MSIVNGHMFHQKVPLVDDFGHNAVQYSVPSSDQFEKGTKILLKHSKGKRYETKKMTILRAT